jgi:hypothetical protein
VLPVSTVSASAVLGLVQLKSQGVDSPRMAPVHVLMRKGNLIGGLSPPAGYLPEPVSLLKCICPNKYLIQDLVQDWKTLIIVFLRHYISTCSEPNQEWQYRSHLRHKGPSDMMAQSLSIQGLLSLPHSRVSS